MKEDAGMLLPQDFFDLKEWDHQAIFSKEEAVWTALDRLPDYLASFFQKSWALSNITGQVDKALVIYQGAVRDDLEVKSTGRLYPRGLSCGEQMCNRTHHRDERLYSARWSKSPPLCLRRRQHFRE